MRSRFDEQLNRLNAALIELGGMVEYAIGGGVKALCRQDLPLAREVMAFDHAVDQKEREIEQMCIRLLLQQQPCLLYTSRFQPTAHSLCCGGRYDLSPSFRGQYLERV